NRNREAIVQYEELLKTTPADAAWHHWLATALARERRFDEARGHFEISLRLKPDNPAALNDLAWLLTAENIARRNVAEGVHLAERACELTTNREPMYLDTLAVAYSEAGRFDK